MAWIAGIAVCLAVFGAVAWLRATGRLGHTPAHLADACMPGRIGEVALERGAAIHWSRSATANVEGRKLEVRLSATEQGVNVALEAWLDPEVPFRIIGAALGGSQVRPGPSAFRVPLLGPHSVECPPEIEAQLRAALDAQACKRLRGALSRGVSILGRSARLSTFVARPSPMLNRAELAEQLQGKLRYDVWARDVLAAAAAACALPVDLARVALAAGTPAAEGPEPPSDEPALEVPPDMPVKCALCGFENEPGSSQCRRCGRSLATLVQRRFMMALLQKKERTAGQLSDSLDREVHEEAFREKHGAELQHLEQRLLEEGEKARAEFESRQAAGSAVTHGVLLAGGAAGLNLHGLVVLFKLVTGMKRRTAAVIGLLVVAGIAVAALTRHLDDELLAALFGFFGLLSLLGLAFGRRGP